MNSLSNAVETILRHIKPTPTESLSLLDAAGRVLSEDVVAACDLPPFDHSTMDGYAVKASECAAGARLPVIGVVTAGGAADETLRCGAAMRITTGAPMPADADAVVPWEQTELRGDDVLLRIAPDAGAHVRCAGSDCARGDRLLPRGARLTPTRIALLASAGVARAPVHCAPKVAVLSTGDELTADFRELSRGKIHDANTPALAAAIAACGAVAVVLPPARDHVGEIAEALSAVATADAVVFSAGGARGEKDLARAALSQIGAQIIVDGVSARPGKGMIFALHGERPVFALPGNPVSALTVFHECVRPALRRMQGDFGAVLPLVAKLAFDVAKEFEKTTLLRVTAQAADGEVRLVNAGAQNTASMNSLQECNALAVLPAGRSRFAEGAVVAFHPLDDWLF